MELNVVAASLLRRWYVVVVGVLMTTGLVYLAYTAVPPTFSAAASVILTPPDASVPDGSNALLQLSGLEQPASLVVAYLAGDEARAEFHEQHPDETYEVILDPLSRGPLVVLTVLGPTQDGVMDGLDTALDAVPEALAQLQDQVEAPPESRLGTTPLTVDPEPTTVTNKTLRAVIAAAGVGLALTLVAAVGLDSMSATRRARRSASRALTATESPVAPIDEPPTAPSQAPADAEPVPHHRAGSGRVVGTDRQRGKDWSSLDPSESTAEAPDPRVTTRA